MAQLLRERGYDAYALRGGLQAWYDTGFDLEPKTAERRRRVTDVCPDCGRPHTPPTASGAARPSKTPSPGRER